MNKSDHLFFIVAFIFLLTAVVGAQIKAQSSPPAWMKETRIKLQKEMVSKYGDSLSSRIQQGLKQVAGFWLEEDGDAAVFENFVRTNFAKDQQALDIMFGRFEYLLEQLYGHLNEINREFRQQADLDLGTIYPFDEIFASYSPGAHITDDFFKNKLAFIVLLNFPLTTLKERLEKGPDWTRRRWAEVRLAQRFSKRIPSDVNQAVSEAAAVTDQYISEYNIYMHHLVDSNGERLFPPKMRLLSHWNLRDELKADYNDKDKGVAKQKLIEKVMERIVTQTIPEIVIDNPNVDWDPFTNEVKETVVHDVEAPEKRVIKISNATEPDTRYATLLKAFRASKKVDPYSPTAPTLIARQFDESREIPEAKVQKMLESVLSSPHIKQIAEIIEKRLGRSLEPYDIWYNGFRSSDRYSESQLDEIVKKRYPTTESYKADMPNLLMKLGFSKERAEYLANNIEVDPARGSGHAMGAAMRSAKAHLRTRVGTDGMDYKGFNIAVHEMGHNVEQTISLNEVDHYLLNGVPNTAFTEAIAFIFQSRDMELLGLHVADPQVEILKTMNDFWMTYEISGVALVDMGIWHWMYDNPGATPAQLKEGMLKIAKEVWNKYYAPVFKKKDVLLLGIYSHIIHSFLYIPDYAIGHLISHQIDEFLKGKEKIGPEIERMVKSGCIAPDIWMKNATGSAIGTEPLLKAAERALKEYHRVSK